MASVGFRRSPYLRGRPLLNDVDYAAIFEALPSPFMVLDRDLRYVAVNAAYVETTGRSREQLIGGRLIDIFPNKDESGKRLMESLRRVLANGEPDTLAYLPYPIANENGTLELRYWSAVHVPIYDASGAVRFVMQNTVDVTEYARMREVASLPFTTLQAETQLIERTREAEAASAEFRRLFQQAPAFFAVLSGPDHIFTFASDSYTRLVGGRNVVGLSVAEALPEVVDQGFVSLLNRVFQEGYVHQAESARLMLVRQPGLPPEETFLDFSYNPIRDADGNVSGIFVQGMDRTESVRATHRQRLLIDELNHRVKNTLATVQSIAAQTFRSTPDPEQARTAFEARILALSKAHSMLSERQWHDTEIGSLFYQELSVYGAERVRSGGPALMINAKATVALALLMHELATNAVKHGALSEPEGALSVHWDVAADDALEIRWQERGGPPVAIPARRGFGSRLLQTVVAGELSGQLAVDYDPAGFGARIVIPADAYLVEENDLG